MNRTEKRAALHEDFLPIKSQPEWGGLLPGVRRPFEPPAPAGGHSHNSIWARAAERCTEISIMASVLDGQPCITGTRIPVHSVLRAIEQYGSIDAAIHCYPQLTVQQVKDALYFAQRVLEPADGGDETSPSS